jgi:tRNA pseudouridine38-40 synthase
MCHVPPPLLADAVTDQKCTSNSLTASTARYDKGPFEHFAFVIGYCGTAFRGLQLQAHTYTHHTVEGTIIQALRDAGLVRSIERGKIADFANGFFRSCRTDKGVHAVRNVVSWTVSKEYLLEWLLSSGALFSAQGDERLDWAKACTCISDAVNARLPLAIRVFSLVKVTRQFHPKDSCFRRIYRYLIPLYAVLGKADGWESLSKLFPDLKEFACTAKEVSGMHDIERFVETSWGAALSVALTKANDALLPFLGSRRYHNFCGGGAGGDDRPSTRAVISPLSDEAVRTIYRCEVASKLLFLSSERSGATRRWLGDDEDAKLRPAAGWPVYPYVVFQVEGASFLLNMIRKMVGILIAVLNGSRVGLVEESLSPGKKVAVPMAPAQHLSLVNSFYTHYDTSSLPKGFAPISSVTCGPSSTSTEAKNFLEAEIYGDILDIDLNRMPSLETLLWKRNSGMTSQQREDDKHLASMKEFIPLPSEGADGSGSAAFAAASPMTIFLRGLRVHNWAIKDVPVPEGCKAANGERNRAALLAAASPGDAAEDGGGAVLAKPGIKRRREERDAVLDDGWLASRFSEARECLTRRRCAVDIGLVPKAASGEE